MWHVFDRAYDLSLVLKQGLSISAENVLFIRIIRVKTSEEQGLSLFTEKEAFSTCTVYAIAWDLLMQSAPFISLFPQLTTKIDVSDPASMEIIKEATSGLANTRASGVHSYVNKILKYSESGQVGKVS